jgi:MFS family permease
VVRFGQPDGIDCRAGAGRAAVRVWAACAVWVVRRLICDGGHVVLDHCSQAADGRQSAGDRAIDLSGIHYIRERRNILGAISLDLFVVLLGGATALLPAYARDILHTGPWGLGLLRLAPAVGALSTSVFLAHHPIRTRAGQRMFAAVIVFGVATVAFALSRNVWLSMAILCLLGAADVTSAVVRSSLVQLETPDEMRGRVSAVNSLFIGTSNQLGEFESGVTASWFGIIPATILGGVGSIVVALIWMVVFPDLRKLESLAGSAADEKVQLAK